MADKFLHEQWMLFNQIDMKGPERVQRPCGIAINSRSNILVAGKLQNNFLYLLSWLPLGHYRFDMYTGRLIPGISIQSDVKVSSVGDYYVTNSGQFVQRYDRYGIYKSRLVTISTRGDPSDSQHTQLHGLAIDDEDHIFVGEILQKYISIHRADGSHIASIKVHIKPVSLATSQHRIIISDWVNSVQIVDTGGIMLYNIKHPGVSRWSPRGITTYRNVIYVCNNDGICCFSLSGEYLGSKPLSYPGGPLCITFTPDGKKVLVAYDGGIAIYQCMQPTSVQEHGQAKQFLPSTEKSEGIGMQHFGADYAASRAEDIEKISLNAEIYKETLTVTSSGAIVSLPAVGVSLQIPPDAIPKKEVVRVTLSIPDDDDLPLMDDDHSLICPIVKCEPEGTTFLKPATLILPSCAAEDSECHVTIWTKPSQTNGQWMKMQGSDHSVIQNRTIKIKLKHFTKYAGTSDSPFNREIIVFQSPAALEGSMAAYITVYAVPDFIVDLIKDDERKSEHDSRICARNLTMELKPNQKNLKISLKDILPQPGWKPEVANTEIPYKRLQGTNYGNASQRNQCAHQFRFLKDDSIEKEIKEIGGSIQVSQAENDETATGYFDVGMMSQWEPGTHVGGQHKRKMTTPPHCASKRSNRRESNMEQSLQSPAQRLEPGECSLTFQGTGMEKVSENDISDVVEALNTHELRDLYEKLGLSHRVVIRAEASEAHTAPGLKAKSVLRHWLQINGRDATRKKILIALEECRCKNTMEELQDK